MSARATTTPGPTMVLAVMFLTAHAQAGGEPTATEGVATQGVEPWWTDTATACREGTLRGEVGKRVYCAGPDGRASGRATAWHDNGKLASDGTYAEGKEDGFVRTWNPDGAPVIEAHYEAGVLNGRAIVCGEGRERVYWDARENGRKLGWYDNGGKAAEIIYDEGGRVLREIRLCRKAAEITYSGGKENGVAFAWHENGQLASRSYFSNGTLEGEAVTWHANGNKASEVTYVGGVLHGKSTSWFTNGRVAAVGQFVGGEKHGQWTHWFEQGRGSRTVHWQHGEQTADAVATAQ